MPNTSDFEQLEVACGGGLMLDTTSQNTPFGAATILQNFEPGIKGGYRRLSGFAQFSTTALTGAGKVLGITFLGSNVIACRGANVEYGTGTTWTSITGARTSAEQYQFDKYNWTGTELIVMADHVNPAATWDGTSYVLLDGAIGAGFGTAPTAPDDVKEFKGHMFFLQDNILTFSAPYGANDFRPASGAGSITLPDAGIGMKSFREFLFVFCKNSIYKIIGSSIEDFDFKPISKNVGCVSAQTIQEINGDLLFLAPDGLRTISGTAKIDDIELGTISHHIQTLIKNLDETTYTFSSLVIRGKNQYRMWYVPDTATENNTRGVLAAVRPIITATSKDSNPREGSNEWEFSEIIGIRSVAAASGFIGNVEYYLHGGKDNGIIYKQESGNNFDATGISYSYRTPDFSFGDMGLRKKLKRIILNLDYESTVTPSINVIYDYGSIDTAQPATYSIAFPTTLYVYGGTTATYGTATYALNTEAINRVWMQGSGFLMAIKITGSTVDEGPFTIKGFQVEYSPGGYR